MAGEIAEKTANKAVEKVDNDDIMIIGAAMVSKLSPNRKQANKRLKSRLVTNPDKHGIFCNLISTYIRVCRLTTCDHYDQCHQH